MVRIAILAHASIGDCETITRVKRLADINKNRRYLIERSPMAQIRLGSCTVSASKTLPVFKVEAGSNSNT